MYKEIISFLKKTFLFEMEEDKEDKENIIDTSLITIALSGTTGGAVIGATFFGLVGGVVGGVAGTLVTGYSEYSNRKQRRQKIKNNKK